MAKTSVRVAVVDDDRGVRDLLQTLLRDEGYEPILFDSDQELVPRLTSVRPAVIIIDWRLGHGEGAGFAAVRASRTLATVPVLICTGDLDAMRKHAPRLATQPNVSIVEKPFQIDVMLAALQRLASISDPAAARPQPGRLSPLLQAAIGRRTPTTQARGVLEAVRETDGWACAELWVSDRGLLRCVAAVADEARVPFTNHSRATSMVPGFGLPGRVWTSGRSAWIEDVEHDRNFPRIEAARLAGLHAAVGVPIHLGSAPVGMIGVYAPVPRAPDQPLLQRLEEMATGLGGWLDGVRGDLLRPDAVSAAARGLASEAARRADVAAVDLVGRGGNLYRVAVAHRDPALTEVALRLEAFAPEAEGPVSRAIQSGEVQRLAVSDATLRRWSGSPEHLLVLRALQMRSLVSIPLLATAAAVGAVTLASTDPGWHASSAASEAVDALSASAATERLARAAAKLA